MFIFAQKVTRATIVDEEKFKAGQECIGKTTTKRCYFKKIESAKKIFFKHNYKETNSTKKNNNNNGLQNITYVPTLCCYDLF